MYKWYSKLYKNYNIYTQQEVDIVYIGQKLFWFITKSNNL